TKCFNGLTNSSPEVACTIFAPIKCSCSNNRENYCFEWNDNKILISQPNQTNVPCHLVAAVFPTEVYQSTSTNKTFICSTHNEILRLILKYLHCDIEIIKSDYNYGGKQTNNGKWDGILSYFDNKKADFIPHIFTSSPSRHSLIEFDLLIPQKELVTIFSTPHVSFNRSIPSISSIFPTNIWTISKFTINNWKELLDEFFYSYLEIFGLFIGQGIYRFSQNIYTNPLILWVIFSFIIRQLFSSNITAILLARGEEYFNSFEQLYKLDSKIKLLMIKNSTTHQAFISKYPDLYNKIEFIRYQDVNYYKTINKMLQMNHLMIIPRGVAESIRMYYSNIKLFISKEGFASAYGNYAIRKSLNLNYKRKLNKLFRNIFYFGLNGMADKTIKLNNIYLNRSNGGANGFISNIGTFHSNYGNIHIKRAVMIYLPIYLYGIIGSIAILLMELFSIHFQRLTCGKP
ncbi:hypothetical protein BLOT_008081, partial [Blomia tropicalis]